MDEKDLDFIRKAGETLTTEFMENVSKKLASELVALANKEGGTLFLGINDENQIVGIDVTNKLKSRIEDVARNCDPSINVTLEEIGEVLAVHVPEGKDKPYRCSSGFYLRQGTNSQKLARDEILEFGIEEGKIRFDDQSLEDFVFLEILTRKNSISI